MNNGEDVNLYEDNNGQNDNRAVKDNDKNENNNEIDDNNDNYMDDDVSVKHPYLRGVLSLSRSVHFTWPLHSSSNSNNVHVMFCVVWLLTWCILGALLMKLFSRIKLWRRGCR